jgi:beta-N-acetylhexosaminidase
MRLCASILGRQLLNTTLDLSELDSKIGQLFMAGIPGKSLDDGTEALIRDCNLGGVILFSRNIEGPEQVAQLCQGLQDAAMKHQNLPLFLAVDQEGGRVARLGTPFTRFPGNEAIGKDDSPLDRAKEFGLTTATEMKLVGLNMNMAPVVDVQNGEPEKHLAGRTFGADPDRVGELGGAVIESLQVSGIMAVAKHFPGLGRAPLDPHLELPCIEADMKEMEAVHLPPFRSAIEKKVSAIMTSHAVYPALDPRLPATLSAAVLTGLLRKKMAFEGLIISDDLEMGAISKQWGVAEGAATSFEAGSDILLICKEQEYIQESFRLIRGKLLKGEIPLRRLHESNERIRKAKEKFLHPMTTVSLSKVREYFNLG